MAAKPMTRIIRLIKDQLLFTNSQNTTNKINNAVINGKNKPRKPVNHQLLGCSLDAKLHSRKSTPVNIFRMRKNPRKKRFI
jgi:putative heme iron utilization protein